MSEMRDRASEQWYKWRLLHPKKEKIHSSWSTLKKEEPVFDEEQRQ